MTEGVDFAVLPVAVHALATKAPVQVVGADLDFAALPWSDGTRDHKANVPNLGAFAMTAPFEQGELVLGAGVHLHWSLPAVLRRGSVRQTAFCSTRGATPHGGPFFPAAPNRWLVRRIEGGACRAAWMVESDFAAPADPGRRAREGPDAMPVSYPQSFRPPGAAPYVHLGRTLPLTGGYEGARPEDCLAGPDRRRAPLTCVGYGSPEFAALYISEQVASTAVPMLFFSGDQDPRNARCKEFAERTGSRFVSVPGAHHIQMLFERDKVGAGSGLIF